MENNKRYVLELSATGKEYSNNEVALDLLDREISDETEMKNFLKNKSNEDDFQSNINRKAAISGVGTTIVSGTSFLLSQANDTITCALAAGTLVVSTAIGCLVYGGYKLYKKNPYTAIANKQYSKHTESYEFFKRAAPFGSEYAITKRKQDSKSNRTKSIPTLG